MTAGAADRRCYIFYCMLHLLLAPLGRATRRQITAAGFLPTTWELIGSEAVAMPSKNVLGFFRERGLDSYRYQIGHFWSTGSYVARIKWWNTQNKGFFRRKVEAGSISSSQAALYRLQSLAVLYKHCTRSETIKVISNGNLIPFVAGFRFRSPAILI